MASRRRRLSLLGAALAACALVTAPAVQAKAKTFLKTVTAGFCADTSFPVPDGPEAGDYVTDTVATGTCPRVIKCGYGGLPYGARILDVDAGVRATHPTAADLTILLVSPVGIMVPLSAGNGGTGANLGAGSTGCGGTFTLFDDSAPRSIRSVTASDAPFPGSFQPERPLGALMWIFGSGDWRFYFDDTVAGGQGTVEALRLNVTYRYRAKKKAKKTKKGE